MKKQTTTKQLFEAIKSDKLKVTKVEVHYKSSNKICGLNIDTFQESLEYLLEAGIFADCISWHYENKYGTRDYICDSGNMNPYSEKVIIAHLCARDGVNVEDVNKALRMIEEEIMRKRRYEIPLETKVEIISEGNSYNGRKSTNENT